MSQDQSTACAALTDLAECTVRAVDGSETAGTCHEGVCLPSECGNGRLDVGEACEWSALAEGEHCSKACDSNETCGNGVIDTITGEQCDDGNNVSHDGCASACVLEAVDWYRDVAPGPTRNIAAALDVARGKVVMFDGTLGAVYEWDGEWHQCAGITSPSPREQFSMAYDRALGGVVLFGGKIPNDTALLGDTWLWNGSRWTQLPAGPSRKRMAMAYDAKRDVLVMFGGQTTSPLQSTWELTGVGWVRITSQQQPPATQDAGVAMAFDAKHGDIVLYDGATHETWTYDGSWTKRSPATIPTIQQPAMASVSSLEQVVMFGGIEGTSTPSARTYFWDGTDWTLSTAAPSQAARSSHAFAEDGNGRMFVFGGKDTADLDTMWFSDGTTWTQGATPPLLTSYSAVYVPTQRTLVRFGGHTMDGADAEPAETWERSPRGWQRFPDGPAADDSPPPLFWSCMVYDSARDEVVMFGGTDSLGPGANVETGTWIRKDSTWTVQRPATAPPGRAHHAMAYDETRNVVVLYGGVTLDNTLLGDTWLWDGATWTQQATPPALGARLGAAMAYDRAAGHIVLFGGKAQSEIKRDVWIWNGQWQPVSTSSGDQPESDVLASLTWDPAGSRLLLTGGQDHAFDTWAWAGSAQESKWTRVTPSRFPSSRVYATVLPSVDGSGVTVHGGSRSNGSPTGDDWELRSTSIYASDGCALPLDVDGDGMTACDDADCWPVCAPVCPPATSCLAGAPRCGDGTCSAIESCKSCPADCTAGCNPRCGDFVCDPGEACPGDCP